MSIQFFFVWWLKDTNTKALDVWKDHTHLQGFQNQIWICVTVWTSEKKKKKCFYQSHSCIMCLYPAAGIFYQLWFVHFTSVEFHLESKHGKNVMVCSDVNMMSLLIMNRWLDIFCRLVYFAIVMPFLLAFSIIFQRTTCTHDEKDKCLEICTVETSLKCFYLVESLQIKPLISEDIHFLHHEQHLKKLTEENKQEKCKLLHDPNIAHEDNSKNDHQGN